MGTVIGAVGAGLGERARSTALGIALLLAACTTAGGVAPAPVMNPPAPGCDLTGQSWQQTSAGPCAASTWQFVRSPDGSFQAIETGCANATGTARYDGTTVALHFQNGRSAGISLWPLDASCVARPGTMTWIAGPRAGQTVASTLSPAP